jgi:hypothetical protein
MNASNFVASAPHLQQPGSAMALAYKNGLKQHVLSQGGELPGHAGVAAIAQAAGVDMSDQAAVTAVLAQAVGAPA